MNERIKLPPQDWLGYDPERGDIHGYTFEQMREFAELIVRQCGYYADVFDALECPVDMDPTETKPSDYIKREMGITE